MDYLNDVIKEVKFVNQGPWKHCLAGHCTYKLFKDPVARYRSGNWCEIATTYRSVLVHLHVRQDRRTLHFPIVCIFSPKICFPALYDSLRHIILTLKKINERMRCLLDESCRRQMFCVECIFPLPFRYIYFLPNCANKAKPHSTVWPVPYISVRRPW